MKINKDLYVKDLLKTSKTTSDIDTYSCTYINNQLSNMYTKTAGYTHTAADLNNYTADGFYHFDTVSSYTNAPSGGNSPKINYFLVVINDKAKGNVGNVRSNNVIQLWFSTIDDTDMTTDKGMWFRTRCWGYWSTWIKLN